MKEATLQTLAILPPRIPLTRPKGEVIIELVLQRLACSLSLSVSLSLLIFVLRW